MIVKSSSPIVSLGARTLSPVIQLYAFYVIAHGHYSPGGGFQGGALLAASIILVRLSSGQRIGDMQFNKALGTPLSSVGALIYAGTGIVALLLGGNFLQYAEIPLLGGDPVMRRNMGILLVELGVALAVTVTFVSIYDDLTEPDDD